MSQAFALFPWDKPFLEHLQNYMCDVCQGNLGSSVLIVPHNRPRRYLLKLFAQNTGLARPALLPRMYTIAEMVGLFRAHAGQVIEPGAFLGDNDSFPLYMPQGLGRKAAKLDTMHIMYRAVQRVGREIQEHEEDAAIAQKFAHMDLATFLPWGVRLVALFEEYMTQLLPVQDVLYTEGEVSATASALLGALGRIHGAYRQLLQEEGWTTAGLDACIAAQALRQDFSSIPPALLPQPEKNAHVFVAGFSTITACEHVFLKALWQQGAHICLHSDPALAQKNASAHWSCQDHVTWLKRWNASCELVVPASKQTPKMHFLAGYDVHSQLLHLQEELKKSSQALAHEKAQESAREQSVAVVLGSSSLLMPVLHHLPERDFNVSMGYPMDKSSLFSLIETLMRLQENARGGEDSPRRYYWRYLLHALRHPFVQMLRYGEGQDSHSLHSLLGLIEKALRQGNRFVSQEEVLHIAALQAEVTPQGVAMLSDVLTCLLHNFAQVHSTQSMGEAVSLLCHSLLQYGAAMWKRYPLDAESLYRLLQKVIPTLKAATIAQETLPQSTLFALCRQLIVAERVPFEADPITGLQVLGMLETRLLHFDKVLILDATDDALPGFAAQDPLLPDALRQVIGLPALQERERVMAHTLYRLASSAKDVYFYWQEGMQRSALFDGKKSRSRFVDAYLWKEEQKLGHIIENDTAPLESAPCPVAPIEHEEQILEVHAGLRQKIIQLLQKGISPTKLDSYLRCPQRFMWENMYKLRPLDEVNEGDDPAAVGQLLHSVLQEAYTPFVGQSVPPQGLDEAHVQELFEKALANSSIVQSLPPQSLMLLRMAAPVRLQQFLRMQIEQAPETEVVALEHSLLVPIEGLFQQTFHLTGTFDRVDTRVRSQGAEGEHMEGLVVLDYKTGKLPSVKPKVWENTELWKDIGLWSPTASNSYELLNQVADAFASVQLPCYIYMCQQHFDEDVLDAALVDLGKTGKEFYLLGTKMDVETCEDIMTLRIPQLLTFLVNHMYTAEEFHAREGAHCTYCAYGALCKR